MSLLLLELEVGGLLLVLLLLEMEVDGLLRVLLLLELEVDGLSLVLLLLGLIRRLELRRLSLVLIDVDERDERSSVVVPLSPYCRLAVV